MNNSYEPINHLDVVPVTFTAGPIPLTKFLSRRFLGRQSSLFKTKLIEKRQNELLVAARKEDFLLLLDVASFKKEITYDNAPLLYELSVVHNMNEVVQRIEYFQHLLKQDQIATKPSST